PEPESYASVWFDAVERRTAVYDRALLGPGDVIEGPAVLHESASTTVIDPGWRGEILSGGELLLCRVGQASLRAPAHQSAPSGQESAHGSSEADPVLL